jgi:hypothetical protein
VPKVASNQSMQWAKSNCGVLAGTTHGWAIAAKYAVMVQQLMAVNEPAGDPAAISIRLRRKRPVKNAASRAPAISGVGNAGPRRRISEAKMSVAVE